MTMNFYAVTALFPCDFFRTGFECGTDATVARGFSNAEITDAAKIPWQCQLRDEMQGNYAYNRSVQGGDKEGFIRMGQEPG